VVQAIRKDTMLDSCDRVFKEWDLSCRAMCDGRQTLLVRKGGIREDGGVFVLDDTEFWLMPTFDHQNANMLQPNYVEELKRLGDANPNPDIVTIRGYAIVDSIWSAKDDEQVNGLKDEMIWNEEYVKLRFNYNPYDPLFLIMLRVYRLPEPVQIPMLKAYGGCKSWVTLVEPLSTHELQPAISDAEFTERKSAISARIG